MPDPAGAAGSGESAEERETAYELLRRGHELLRARHNAQAAVVLERAARAEPGKGSILEALGRAYYDSGQHARAAATFEALLEVDPSAHYGHLGLGLSLERLGRLGEARTHLRLAVAMHPESATYRRALRRVESSCRAGSELWPESGSA
jgi:Flp pilus assembly protein TadD